MGRADAYFRNQCAQVLRAVASLFTGNQCETRGFSGPARSFYFILIREVLYFKIFLLLLFIYLLLFVVGGGGLTRLIFQAVDKTESYKELDHTITYIHIHVQLERMTCSDMQSNSGLFFCTIT